MPAIEESNPISTTHTERIDKNTVGSIYSMGDVLKYQISTRSILKWLLIITIVLNSLSFIGSGIEYLLGIEQTTPLVHLIHVEEEGNIPTYYSALLLLGSAILLAFIAYFTRLQNKPYFKHWIVLSIIFFYLSIDDAAAIHETIIPPLRALLNTSGIFFYAWVIVAIPLLVVFLLAYFKFVRDLPRQIRNLFIISGALFVFGAMGLDMAAGFVVTHNLWIHTIEPALMITEELLENVGIVLFIYALLSYLRFHLVTSDIQLHLA